MNKKLLLLIGFLLIPFFLFPATSNSTLGINGIVPSIGEYYIYVDGAAGYLGELEHIVGEPKLVGTLVDGYSGNANATSAFKWNISVHSLNGFNLKGPTLVGGDELISYVLDITWQETTVTQGQGNPPSEPAGSWNSVDNAGELIQKGGTNNNKVIEMNRPITVTVNETRAIPTYPAGNYRDTITFTLSTN